MCPAFMLVKDGVFIRSLKWLDSRQIPVFPRMISQDSHALSLLRIFDEFNREPNGVLTSAIGIETILDTEIITSFDMSFPGSCVQLEQNDHLYLSGFVRKLFKMLDSNEWKCLLADSYFWEFDRGSSDFELAGIFQRLHRTVDSRDSFEILLRLLIESDYFKIVEPSKHPLLRRFLRLFGLPIQIGFMCGRGSLIKLVGAIRNMEEFCSFFKANFILYDDSNQHWLSKFSGFCSRTLSCANINYSLDYDFADYRFLPRISFEVTPYWRSKGAVSEVLHAFEELNLSDIQLGHLLSYCKYLPLGSKLEYVELISQLGIIDHHSLRFVALPSHFKISFLYGNASVKSYTWLQSLE